MMIRTIAVRSSLAALGLVMTVSLAGCVTPGSDPAPTNEPTSAPLETPTGSPTIPSPSLAPGASPAPSPSETTPPVEKPTAVSIPCNTVVDAQTMYDFNPNFALLAKFSPDAGTLTARAVSDTGTVCRWLNQTSNDTVDVSISQPGRTALSAAQDAAESGTSVSGLGDAAYFSRSGGVGVVQVFDGPYWITTTSAFFGTAADARSITSAAVEVVR